LKPLKPLVNLFKLELYILSDLAEVYLDVHLELYQTEEQVETLLNQLIHPLYLLVVIDISRDHFKENLYLISLVG
jgi:hypothetical protein